MTMTDAQFEDMLNEAMIINPTRQVRRQIERIEQKYYRRNAKIEFRKYLRAKKRYRIGAKP